MSRLKPVADKSLADIVADQIREAIRAGRYQPGARLVERTLAGELGISHIPIREALARLADEGLVERLPRRGSRVATLSARELEEVSTLREKLEQLVAARVQERMSDAIESELRKIVSSMRQAAGRGDSPRLLELDQRFHERLWKLADHRVLSDFVAQLRRRIEAFLRATTAALQQDELERHAMSHDVLLDAIVSGDRATAEAAMADHIQIAAKRLQASLISGATADRKE